MSKKSNISDHITYREATRSKYASQFGIKNVPSEDIEKNMKLVAEELFEPLREWVKGPIKVNSFYRSEELNTALGGSRRSSHLTGNAIDITSLGKKTNLEMFHYIKDNLDFDQLIWEFGSEPKWLHISYKSKKENRKQVLVTKKRGVYYNWA